MHKGMSFFKLSGLKGDGVNPYINESGAFLGDGTSLLAKDNEGRWFPRDIQELELQLSKEASALCKALNEGDYALASIELVLMRLPAVSGERGKFAKYRPDQPRAPAGQSNG
jgi:hypothetical protein